MIEEDYSNVMVEELIKSMHIESESYDKEKNKVNVRLSFPSDSPIFNGHFPDRPILAGAYQIMLVKYFAENLLNSQLKISLIKKSKFLSLIGADDTFLLEVQTSPLDNEDNKYKIKTKIKFNEKSAMESTLIATLD